MADAKPPDSVTDLVTSMRELAKTKPGLRFVLVMDDSNDRTKNAVLTANTRADEVAHIVACALARLTAVAS